MNKPTEPMVEVAEIFRSIQGESTWAGWPCTFVRLTGCNLRCAYCDTRYAYEGGSAMTLDAVLEHCAELSETLVELTGGEPLAQSGCVPLAERLIAQGYTVLVETNGTLPIVQLPAAAIKIMDIKCPGSGMSNKTDWDNIQALSMQDEVKFVIGGRDDYEWSRDVIFRYDLCSRCRAVAFSPVFQAIDPRSLAEWILKDRLNVRLQLQIHKYLWPPSQRGV